LIEMNVFDLLKLDSF